MIKLPQHQDLPARKITNADQEAQEKTSMQGLLKMSGMIDGMNERIGRATIWLILIVVIISAGNAVSRFALNISSNAMLEVQWYMFSAVFMFCSGYVLNKNEHIRIDVVTGRFSARTQNWIDVFGILVFLLPMAVLLAYLSWPVFTNAWNSGEISQNPGGLVRWPVRLVMPIGFALLILQGISELIKRLVEAQGGQVGVSSFPGQGSEFYALLPQVVPASLSS